MRITAFIQDERSTKDIMKSQGIPEFLIRRSLGVVGKAPPPIPKFIDTTLVRRSAKREGGEALDELPRYDSFDPAPDDF
jgi:hypothetical protein